VNARPRLFWLDAAVKAALVGLLLIGAFSGLERFEGKAMTARLLTYPIAALIVPAGWWLASRRPGRADEDRRDYPYAIDILLVLPFLIDVVGNALDLYDSISWWDDANHLVNWGILVSAFGQFLVRLSLQRAVVFGLAVGFGAVTAVLWEFGEYYTFIRNSPELRTAYTDTLGDLALGLTGSTIAALLTVTVFRARTTS
jgi:hypothetical protein